MHEKEPFFRKKLLDWFEKNGRDFPWRKADDPYKILVGEIMLQKTRAENIIDVYKNFLNKYSDPETLANSDIREIENTVEPLGLYRRRSKTLKQIGNYFNEKGTPKAEEELEGIHGIGRYIANAFLSVAFGKPRPIVDTNVKRIYSRFFSLEVGSDPRRNPKIWEFVEKTLPEGNARDFNLALVDFGAKICKKGSPLCDKCPLRKKCSYVE